MAGKEVDPAVLSDYVKSAEALMEELSAGIAKVEASLQRLSDVVAAAMSAAAS